MFEYETNRVEGEITPNEGKESSPRRSKENTLDISAQPDIPQLSYWFTPHRFATGIRFLHQPIKPKNRPSEMLKQSSDCTRPPHPRHSSPSILDSMKGMDNVRETVVRTYVVVVTGLD